MTINITHQKKNRQRSEIAIKICTQTETYIYYFMPNTPKSLHSYNSIQNKKKQNNNQNSAIIAKHLKCICSFYFIACHTNCAMKYCKMPTIDFKWKFGEISFNNPNYNHFLTTHFINEVLRILHLFLFGYVLKNVLLLMLPVLLLRLLYLYELYVILSMFVCTFHCISLVN